MFNPNKLVSPKRALLLELAGNLQKLLLNTDNTIVDNVFDDAWYYDTLAEVTNIDSAGETTRTNRPIWYDRIDINAFIEERGQVSRDEDGNEFIVLFDVGNVQGYLNPTLEQLCTCLTKTYGLEVTPSDFQTPPVSELPVEVNQLDMPIVFPLIAEDKSQAIKGSINTAIKLTNIRTTNYTNVSTTDFTASQISGVKTGSISAAFIIDQYGDGVSNAIVNLSIKNISDLIALDAIEYVRLFTNNRRDNFEVEVRYIKDSSTVSFKTILNGTVTQEDSASSDVLSSAFIHLTASGVTIKMGAQNNIAVEHINQSMLPRTHNIIGVTVGVKSNHTLPDLNFDAIITGDL